MHGGEDTDVGFRLGGEGVFHPLPVVIQDAVNLLGPLGPPGPAPELPPFPSTPVALRPNSGVMASTLDATEGGMATLPEKLSSRANAPPGMPFAGPRLVSMYEGDSATTASG